MQKIALN